MSSQEARLRRIEAKLAKKQESGSVNKEWYNLTFEQFWQKLLPPKLKDGSISPILSYEQEILNSLDSHKRIWIKKARGLGITEFFLRYMLWLAHKPEMVNSQMAIVVGPRMELGFGLINRMKKILDKAGYVYDQGKESRLIINQCSIEAYPSNHTEALRSPDAMRFIFLDEADFFAPNEFKVVIDASFGYTAKTNPTIVLVSTPNLPGGQFDQIEHDGKDIWHKIHLPYTVGVGSVYTPEEIDDAKRLDSFEREYNLKYGYGIGNIFPYQLVDAITIPYDLTLTTGDRVLAVDPAYGSSKFAIVGMEMLDGIMYVKEAKQYERPSPSAMLEEVQRMSRDYYRVYVDSAHPGLIRDLRETGVNVEPIIFSKQLGNAEQGMVADASRAVREQRVRIHPAFSELAYQLKAVKFDEKGKPDKKELSFDLGDAFMMAIYMLGGAGLKIFSVEPEKPVVQDAKEPVWTEDGWVYR